METAYVATVIMSFWPVQQMTDVHALVKAGRVSKRWHRGSVDALHIVLCGLQNTVDRLYRQSLESDRILMVRAKLST